MAKKPVNIRLDEKLLNEFDELEGTRTENMEEAMRLYLQRKAGGVDTDTGKDDVDTQEYEALRTEIDHKKEIINLQKDQINTLQFQVGWLQAEHSKLSDRIPALLPAPKTKRKWKWWKKKE